MSKWQKLNLLAFAILIFISVGLVYALNRINFNAPFGKPWHLLPDVHEDSLSQGYLQHYQVLNKFPLKSKMLDSSRVNIFILIDAWGVPVQESELEGEFAFFADLPHIYAVHQRLKNNNKHAEKVEFRKPPMSSIYIFGGDSLEYGRPTLVRELGFETTLFCQKCGDSVMISKIDSLVAEGSPKFIAWTTQSSRQGSKEMLRQSLKQIADFASRHPDIRIVVQGTHRPVLGSGKVRKAYKSHWVPVVELN